MTSVMPWERPGSKIDDRHLQRLAVIYVRQSTRQQLVEHQESTRLQYALVDRAVALVSAYGLSHVYADSWASRRTGSW